MATKSTKSKYKLKKQLISFRKRGDHLNNKYEYIYKFHHIIKTKNYPITNIFFICNENLFSVSYDETLKLFKDDKFLSLLQTNGCNTLHKILSYSTESLLNLEMFMHGYVQDPWQPLWRVAQYSFEEILNTIKSFKEVKEIFIPDLSTKEKDIIELVMTYNKNYKITIDETGNKKIYYITEEGAKIIDIYEIQAGLIFKESFKILIKDDHVLQKSVDPFMYQATMPYIEQLNYSFRDSKSLHINNIICKIAVASATEIKSLFRICLTIITNHNKYYKENETIPNNSVTENTENENDNNLHEKFITNNTTWIPVTTKVKETESALGRLFLSTYASTELNNKRTKKDYEILYMQWKGLGTKNPIEPLWMFDFSIVLTYILAKKEQDVDLIGYIFEYMEEIFKGKTPLIMGNSTLSLIINSIEKAINTLETVSTVPKNVFDSMIRIEEFLISSDTKYGKIFNNDSNKLFKLLKNFIKNIIKIFVMELGKTAMNLLASAELIILKTKTIKEKNKYIQKQYIYIDETFIIMTVQKHSMPSLGTLPITLDSLKTLVPKNNAFLLPFFESHLKTLISFSSKFTVEDLNIKFKYVLDENRNDPTILNLDLIYQHIVPFKELITRYLSGKEKKDFNDFYKFVKRIPQYMNFFLPKETSLEFLEESQQINPTNQKYYQILHQIMDSLLDFDKKAPKTKLTNALHTIKDEWYRVFSVLPTMMSFGVFFQKIWADARARVYPEESVFTNTKAPMYRGLVLAASLNETFSRLPKEILSDAEKELLTLEKVLNAQSRYYHAQIKQAIISKRYPKRKSRRDYSLKYRKKSK